MSSTTVCTTASRRLHTFFLGSASCSGSGSCSLGGDSGSALAWTSSAVSMRGSAGSGTPAGSDSIYNTKQPLTFGRISIFSTDVCRSCAIPRNTGGSEILRDLSQEGTSEATDNVITARLAKRAKVMFLLCVSVHRGGGVGGGYPSHNALQNLPTMWSHTPPPRTPPPRRAPPPAPSRPPPPQFFFFLNFFFLRNFFF